MVEGLTLCIFFLVFLLKKIGSDDDDCVELVVFSVNHNGRTVKVEELVIIIFS